MPERGGRKGHSVRPSLVLTIPILAVLLAARPALASCNPQRTNFEDPYHDGWVRTPSSGPTSTYAKILEYSPYVYPNTSFSPDDTVAWVMLNLGSCAPGGYDQIGWYKSESGLRQTFVEYALCDGTFTDVYGDPFTLGTYTGYRVQLDNVGGNYVDFYAGGSLWANNVPQYVVPDSAQQMAEVQTIASQMPGGSSNREDFQAATIDYGGTRYSFVGTLVNEWGSGVGGDFRLHKVSGQEIQVWDSVCTT
jgi:hypothetical protein